MLCLQCAEYGMEYRIGRTVSYPGHQSARIRVFHSQMVTSMSALECILPATEIRVIADYLLDDPACESDFRSYVAARLKASAAFPCTSVSQHIVDNCFPPNLAAEPSGWELREISRRAAQVACLVVDLRASESWNMYKSACALLLEDMLVEELLHIELEGRYVVFGRTLQAARSFFKGTEEFGSLWPNRVCDGRQTTFDEDDMTLPIRARTTLGVGRESAGLPAAPASSSSSSFSSPSSSTPSSASSSSSYTTSTFINPRRFVMARRNR